MAIVSELCWHRQLGKGILAAMLLLFGGCKDSTQAFVSSAKESIVKVYSYGFVDLEGAKPSSIIVEYDQKVDARSVSADCFEVTDYVTWLERQDGYDTTIERDNDDVKGNEGMPVKVYVNDIPSPSEEGGKAWGNYVVIELNTDYMLAGQNLPYTVSMMAGVKQLKDIKGEKGDITSDDAEKANYSMTEHVTMRGKVVIQPETDKNCILLPQFDEANGWTIHNMGGDGFLAHNCYSEYTGKYYDFELPYAIFVPKKEVMEQHKGDISLVIHMEHAGGNDTDPMSAITSSKAAALLSSDRWQAANPAIVIVPQVEETRRSTNDYVASSEVNTAVWQLLDWLLEKYDGYINHERIYGTGQSMGGMLLLNMSAQRDNFFAGLALIGAQWSSSYDKSFQHDGAPARTPDNDPVSFNGFGLDSENYQNWYYMVSDDNILIHTCGGDPMATGEWQALVDYYNAVGAVVATDEWDPYDPLATQNNRDKALTDKASIQPGGGICWGRFNRGNHMSTWKYGYQLEAPFDWLFAQRRSTAAARGKLELLKNEWLGRDNDGNVIAGSGTKGLNSAQFTPSGPSTLYAEGWTPLSVTLQLMETAATASEDNLSEAREAALKAYRLLSAKDQDTVAKAYPNIVAK
ncbi:MAG: peptidase [Prevotella sp.]